MKARTWLFVFAAVSGLLGTIRGADAQLAPGEAGCGYFGCGFNQDSFLFGAAFGALSPADQAFVSRNDGTAFVQLRNQIYDNTFGINAFPGGFNGLIATFDASLSQVVGGASPQNFYPPVFGQLTSSDICIPGLITGGLAC